MSSKLNSGGLGVMQGALMTAWICWIRSLGQSKDDSCGMLWLSLLGVLMTARIHGIRSLGQLKDDSCGMLQLSLSGRHVDVQGEF